MKVLRITQLAVLSVAGTMALAACGSSSNDAAGSSTGSSTGSGSAANASASSCAPGDLKAAGSTAQQNAMAQAAAGYKATCGAQVSYNGTGSGAGITSFITKQVDFAGSDSALSVTGKDGNELEKAKAACGSQAWDLPMVTGPIAMAFNIKGVDTLVLTPTVTARIFSGKITTWNDPAIAALNSGVTLPDEKIAVFFRSDSSGTTDNFTNYLHTAAPSDWPADHAKDWSGGVGQGKARSAGVSQAISSTEGGIGYVEWSFAITDKLKMAQIDNGSGAVALSADSAGKAVAAAKVVGTGNDLALQIDYATKAPGAYPIVLVTYEIVCSKNADPVTGRAVKSFMTYLAGSDFQDTLTSIGSAPLPESISTKVKSAIAALS